MAEYIFWNGQNVLAERVDVVHEMTYTKRPSVAEIAALHGFAPVPEDIQKQNLDVETL